MEIWRSLQKLKLDQQQVIYLKTVEDMSFTEVAEFLNKKEGAVKMIFYRGVKRLQKILEREESNDLSFFKTKGRKAGS